MRRRKNKKRIDPRHFLSETTFRSEPGATLPRPALLQAIAVAVSRGDLKTAYELLASVSTEEALAIIEQGIEDVLGITIQIEDDEDTDEVERVDEGAREDVDQFADVVDIVQGAGEPFIDVGRQPTKAFKTPPLQFDPVGMRSARNFQAETPGEKVDRALKHKISQAISPQSRSRRRRVRTAADRLGKLGAAGAVADLALAATDSDATGAQRGARGSGAAGELAYLKSLTPKGQQAVRTAAGRHAAGALSKAAPGAFAAQAGYELGKQASPYIAKGVPGLFGPGAAEQAGKGVTDIDWRPSEIGKTLKYMLQPGEQQRESLNLQLSTQSLKEIIQEEIEAVLREAVQPVADKATYAGSAPAEDWTQTYSSAERYKDGKDIGAASTGHDPKRFTRDDARTFAKEKPSGYVDSVTTQGTKEGSKFGSKTGFTSTSRARGDTKMKSDIPGYVPYGGTHGDRVVHFDQGKETGQNTPGGKRGSTSSRLTQQFKLGSTGAGKQRAQDQWKKETSQGEPAASWLKEIIQEEIEAVLREAQKASKSVGDPPYRERGSTESQAQQMAAGAALSARRGETPASKLKGASRDLYNGEISTKDLRNLAKLGQKVKGHKSKEPKHRKSLPGHATPAKD